MKSLLMQIEWTQWILIGFIVLLVIAYPILVSSRNKKENQKMQEQTNSLKRGDKVLTTSGVYGTIVDLEMAEDKKIVTIETGSGKTKGYISVDAYAIYQVFSDKPAAPAAESKAEENPVEENKKVKKSKKVEVLPSTAENAEAIKPFEEKAAETESNTTAEIEAQISGKKSRKK